MDLERGTQGPTNQFVHMALERDRKNFVRKVYGTVGVQLLATAALAAPIATASDVWLSSHAGLMLFSSVGFLALLLLLACGGGHLMRQHPHNLLILAAFTALEAISVGFFCAMYEAQSVVFVIGATAAVVGSLTLFAVTTNFDMTGFGGYLRGASLALFVIGLVGCFVRADFFQMLFALGGAVLMSGYLVYDTQRILGGKHKRRFGLDDYAFAALQLYLDIVELFLHLLALMGERRRR